MIPFYEVKTTTKVALLIATIISPLFAIGQTKQQLSWEISYCNYDICYDRHHDQDGITYITETTPEEYALLAASSTPKIQSYENAIVEILPNKTTQLDIASTTYEMAI